MLRSVALWQPTVWARAVCEGRLASFRLLRLPELEKLLADTGFDRRRICNLRDDSTLLDGIDLLGDGADQRQVLLDDDQRDFLLSSFNTSLRCRRCLEQAPR